MTPDPFLVMIEVDAGDAVLEDRAGVLADRLKRCFPGQLIDGGRSGCDLLKLNIAAHGWELALVSGPTDLLRSLPLRIELEKIDTRSPAARSARHPLFRALGCTSARAEGPVIDATAGLGGDTWLMAARGFEVIAIERHPVLAGMLQEALDRAARSEPEIASRIRVVEADSLTWLRSEAARHHPHAVLIDPMYPGSEERTAKPSKEMRMVRMLVGDDPDSGKLLEEARGCGVGRVLLKRPLHAPSGQGQDAPDWMIRAGRVRYDCWRGRSFDFGRGPISG